MKNAMLVVMLLFTFAVCGDALATDQGRYQCNDCLLDGPHPDPDTRLFISNVVNADVLIWRQGDFVTICNESMCAVYTFSSTVFQRVLAFPNTGSGGGGSDTGGTSGGGGQETTIVSGPGGNGNVYVKDLEVVSEP